MSSQLFTMHADGPVEYRDSLPVAAWSHPRGLQLALGWNRFPDRNTGEKMFGLWTWAAQAQADKSPLVCIDGEFIHADELPLAIDLVRLAYPDARIAAPAPLPYNREYTIRFSQGDGAARPMPADWVAKMDASYRALKPVVAKLDVVLIGAYLLDPNAIENDFAYIAESRRLAKKYWPGCTVGYVVWGDWHEGWVPKVDGQNVPLQPEIVRRYVSAVTRNARYGDICVVFGAKYPQHEEFIRLLDERLN